MLFSQQMNMEDKEIIQDYNMTFIKMVCIGFVVKS